MSNQENKTIEKINFTFEIIPTKNNVIKEYHDIPNSKIMKEVVIYEGSNKVTLKKRLYIGFKTRVTILISLIVLLLLTSGVSFFLVYMASNNYTVKYSEESFIIYKICDNSYSCIESKPKKKILSSECSYINTDFIYNLDISDKIHKNIDYYISGDFIITDKRDSNIVLYRKKDSLVDKTKIEKVTNNIHIGENLNIEYADYYNKVQNYIINNNVDVKAKLIISLYVRNKKGFKKYSTIKMNITDKILSPKVYNSKKKNYAVKIKKDAWTETNIILVIICVISGLLILLLFIKLCNILLKAFYRKDKYHKEVNKILRKYDSDIVVARDGFISLENKKVIKVSDFKELLDAKNILKKPIVYVRINEIKSRFIVEDVDSIYEYTIKDLDF